MRPTNPHRQLPLNKAQTNHESPERDMQVPNDKHQDHPVVVANSLNSQISCP